VCCSEDASRLPSVLERVGLLWNQAMEENALEIIIPALD